MAGTQQPPLSNWPQAPAGGQPPVPGAGFAQAGYPMMTAGQPRRRKRRLVIALAAVFVVACVIVGVVLGGTPKGSLALPGTLLGQHKATSASAVHLASQLKAQESAGTSGKLTGVVAGVYGSPVMFAISGGGICGTCTAKSATVVRSNLAANGYADAAIFPAGSKGGVLACGSRSSQGASVIRCTWVDNGTAGDVLFAAGAASGLADAAAKTNQLRVATER